MTRLLRSISVVAILAVAVACDDDDSPLDPSSETVTFVAQLAPANEVPPVTNAEASGSGTVRIDLRLNRDSGNAITSATADFQVSLAGFPPATPLTMAHIHEGAIGVAGSIVVDTGLVPGEVFMTNGSGAFTKTGVGVAPTLAQLIVATPANFYFNVHSQLNPAGVARGQLVRQ